MQTKTILAASLALPLLVLACNRADQSPTAANTSPEKQAMSSPAPDQTLERSAPPNGMPSEPSSPPSTPPNSNSSAPGDGGTPAQRPNEPAQSG